MKNRKARPPPQAKKPMRNRDVFDFDKEQITVLLEDKHYSLKFTMHSLFALEKKYVSIKNAIEGLRGEPLQALEVIADFLRVAAAFPPVPENLYEILQKTNGIEEVFGNIFAAILRDFTNKEAAESDNKENNDGNNWDEIYFIARYKLLMADDEFWGSSPRRFNKLHEMWIAANSVAGKAEETKPEIYMGEVEY